MRSWEIKMQMTAAGRRRESRAGRQREAVRRGEERIDNISPPKTEEPSGNLHEGADVGMRGLEGVSLILDLRWFQGCP